MSTYTFRGGYIEDEAGDRWWSADLLAKVEKERDDARAERDHHKAMQRERADMHLKAAEEVERLTLDRNYVRELLAKVFDRYACAACSHGKTGPECPCGFHAAGAYLDRTEKP